MEKYSFTLSTTLRGSPRIQQEKYYVELFTYKLASSLWFLFSAEKNKDKKANKDVLNFYEQELKKLGLTTDKNNYFTKDTLYYNSIGKHVETKEGWWIGRKIN